MQPRAFRYFMIPDKTSRAMFHVKRYALFLLSILLLASCASVSRDLVTGKRKAFGYDWAQQVQLGQEADPQIVAQFGIYEDEALNRYVTEVGQKVLAVSHLRRPESPPEVRNTPFTFRVLDSPVINAFAVPGGFIYVTRGLVAHCENEAQLAMVLGHEISHIARQHSARQAFEAQRTQYLLLGGALLGQATLGGSAAENILGLGGQAAQLLLLKYGRGDEREADHWGTEYASLAGYKAAEGAAFFNTLDRIQAESGRALPNWQSSHPDPGEREQTILQLAAEWDAKTPQSVVGRAELLNQLEGVVFGENPRNGFVRNSVFLHPELRFQFNVPQGYQVANEASRVAIVAPEGRAYVLLTLGQSNSIQEEARTFAAQQGITVVDSGSDRVNGLEAAYVVADAQTQQGVIRLLNYFISYNGRVYSLMGVTTQQAFETYRRDFLALMNSFRPLTDNQILNTQPARINIITASRNAPFQSFIANALPFDITALDLAIANQVGLDEVIPSGQKLKVIR